MFEIHPSFTVQLQTGLILVKPFSESCNSWTSILFFTLLVYIFKYIYIYSRSSIRDYSSRYIKYVLTGWGVLQVSLTKLSFIVYMVRRFFFIIIELFSSTGRRSVVSNLKSSSKCAISSGVGQNCIFEYVIILSWFMSFVIYINILPSDVLCKIAI